MLFAESSPWFLNNTEKFVVAISQPVEGNAYTADTLLPIKEPAKDFPSLASTPPTSIPCETRIPALLLAFQEILPTMPYLVCTLTKCFSVVVVCL